MRLLLIFFSEPNLKKKYASSKRQKKINAWKRRIKIDKLREIQALEQYKRTHRN